MPRSKTKKKSRSKPTIRARLISCVFLFLFLYFTYTIIHTQILIYREKEALEDINNQIEQQELLGDDLRRHLVNGGDEEYIERVAREKLGYAAPGEQVFVDTGSV